MSIKSKNDFQNTTIMSEVNWSLYDDASKANGQFEMDQIAWPNELIILCQIDRCEDMKHYELIIKPDDPKGVTYGYIIAKLYEFYNDQPLSISDVDTVKRSMNHMTYEEMTKKLHAYCKSASLPIPHVNANEPKKDYYNDPFDYKKDALAMDKFNWIDLMGDCVIFEGIKMKTQHFGYLSLAT